MSSYKNEKLEKIYKKLPTINCKGKCHEACGFIKMSPYEHDRITKFVGHDPFPSVETILDKLQRNDLTEMSCSLLKDGKCSIYRLRPLVCRLYGLVKKLQCPFGCVPSRWMTDDEARELINKAERL